jgi:hypothetical protein
VYTLILPGTLYVVVPPLLGAHKPDWSLVCNECTYMALSLFKVRNPIYEYSGVR